MRSNLPRARATHENKTSAFGHRCEARHRCHFETVSTNGFRSSALWSLLALAPLLLACGNTRSEPAGGLGGASGEASVELAAGAGGDGHLVLAPASESLPVCDEPMLRVSGASDSSDNWQKDGLLFPGPSHTFRGYAMRGPIDSLTGIWSSGSGQEPFEDREVRPLTNALIACDGKLLCAAGSARALRNGVFAALELSGLGPLDCSGEPVPGELRYCHDCQQDSYAIVGTLEGEPVLEVSGSQSRVGDTLYLQIGWGVLVAKLRQEGATEALVSGAYLSRSGQLYCVGSATGNARDVAAADVTFAGFRRSAACQADDLESTAQACVMQF
jgi:hypothetical protein